MAILLFRGERDLVLPTLPWNKAALEYAPATFHRRKLQALRPPGWRRHLPRQNSVFDRKPRRVQDGALEENGLASLGHLRAVGKADALAFGEVALMGHPTHHLA